MQGKQALGMGLLILGLLLFVAAILGRAGATMAALVYGDSVLKPAAPGTAPTQPAFKIPSLPKNLIPVPKKLQPGGKKP